MHFGIVCQLEPVSSVTVRSSVASIFPNENLRNVERVETTKILPTGRVRSGVLDLTVVIQYKCYFSAISVLGHSPG